MKKIFAGLSLAVIILGSVLISANVVFASGLQDAGNVLNKVTNNTGLEGTLSVSAGAVIKGVLALVGTIFFGLTIYAGILWMTAAGEEEKVTKAKEIIKQSITGLVVIMAAYAITVFVTSRLGVGGGGGVGGAPLGDCLPPDTCSAVFFEGSWCGAGISDTVKANCQHCCGT
ncbi:MAG: hypothetical protein Q7S66_04270 [bacterium]|nr:hypothetical protein [bacterium]